MAQLYVHLAYFPPSERGTTPYPYLVTTGVLGGMGFGTAQAALDQLHTYEGLGFTLSPSSEQQALLHIFEAYAAEGRQFIYLL